jgi:hypothetical protein
MLDHITCTISTKQVEAHETYCNDNHLPFSYTFIFNNNVSDPFQQLIQMNRMVAPTIQ